MGISELRNTGHTPTLQGTFSDLYERLDQAGFDKKFVIQYLLPTWWNDNLESVPET